METYDGLDPDPGIAREQARLRAEMDARLEAVHAAAKQRRDSLLIRVMIGVVALVVTAVLVRFLR